MNQPINLSIDVTVKPGHASLQNHIAVRSGDVVLLSTYESDVPEHWRKAIKEMIDAQIQNLGRLKLTIQ